MNTWKQELPISFQVERLNYDLPQGKIDGEAWRRGYKRISGKTFSLRHLLKFDVSHSLKWKVNADSEERIGLSVKLAIF